MLNLFQHDDFRFFYKFDCSRFKMLSYIPSCFSKVDNMAVGINPNIAPPIIANKIDVKASNKAPKCIIYCGTVSFFG